MTMDTGVTARRFGAAAIIIALLMLGLALVTGRMSHAKGVERVSVVTAVVRLPAVPGRPAAGYMTVTGGVEADQLTSVTMSAPTRIELHESRMMQGTMSMARLAAVDIPAKTAVAFAPAGKHLMIFNLPASVKAGTSVSLTLNFVKAGPVAVQASVQATGDAAAHAHH